MSLEKNILRNMSIRMENENKIQAEYLLNVLSEEHVLFCHERPRKTGFGSLEL